MFVKTRINKIIYELFYHAILLFFNHNFTIKQKINNLLIRISSVFGLSLCLGKPVLLTIEPTNVCDQKCPICETGNGELGRTQGFMSMDQFKYIIDQFDSTLNRLFFYFMGEPFLNKYAYEMIKYAKSKKIYIETCTNGNFVDPQKLIDSQIDEVNFQISGMTQDIHEIYRVGGNIEQIKARVIKTIELRNSLKTKTKITIGYILMKHNEHQLNDFIEFCKSIKVDQYNIIGTTARTIEQAIQYMPSQQEYRMFDEEKIKRGILSPKKRPDNYCGYLYGGINIMVNGDVVSCCRDPKGMNILGNVFSESIYKIWNNKKYRNIRKKVNRNSNQLPLCSLCPGENVPQYRGNTL